MEKTAKILKNVIIPLAILLIIFLGASFFLGEETDTPKTSEAEFGPYGDCKIIIEYNPSSMLNIIVDIEIAGITFSKPPQITQFVVHHEEEIAALKNAYEKGWLSQEDIASFADDYNQWLKNGMQYHSP